jgi:hypothetical protein
MVGNPFGVCVAAFMTEVSSHWYARHQTPDMQYLHGQGRYIAKPYVANLLVPVGRHIRRGMFPNTGSAGSMTAQVCLGS